MSSEVIAEVRKRAGLLDAVVENLSLVSTDASADARLTIRRRNGERALVALEGLKRVVIDYDDAVRFWIVAQYKIVLDGETYYVSLDPYLEDDQMDERDNFVFICSRIVVTEIASTPSSPVPGTSRSS